MASIIIKCIIAAVIGYICGYLSNLREIRETKKKIKLLEEFKQWGSDDESKG